MKHIWITDETPPRALFVKGRSAIDPDCLVAWVEGEPDKSLWIVDDGIGLRKPVDSAFVCGLPGNVRARRIDLPDAALAPSRPDRTEATK